MASCAVRQELSAAAMKILEAIAAKNMEQVHALRDRDQSKLMQLDKEVEELIGKKERTFGALRQHTAEHGC
jgi:hypothetical protein